MAEQLEEAAPGPYPLILQHRELDAGKIKSSMYAVRHSDISRLVIPDPDIPMTIIGLPSIPSAESGGGGGGGVLTSGAPLNSDALNPEEREKLCRLVVERGEMAEASEKRRRQAKEVIQESGVPLAFIPPGGIDIFHAACDGDARMIQENVRLGVDINALGQPHPECYDGVQFEKRWFFYGPPIAFAAAFGRERAVKALIEWGADVHQRSSTGLTAKEYAMKRGYGTIVALIEEAEARERAAAPKLRLVREGV